MIGIIGNMSGGKTYTAVEYMLDNLLTGCIVCTNVKLKCQGVSDYLQIPCVLWKKNYYFLTEQPNGYNHILINDYEHYPCGWPRGKPGYEKHHVFIYYDEVSSVFDSLTHGTDRKIQEVAVWARHTEKRGQTLYLIMQFANELHKRLRTHITEYLSCTNSTNIRIPVFRTRLPWFLRGMIIRVRYSSDGETLLDSATWDPIKPLIYRCYDTAQIVFGQEFQTTTVQDLDFTYRQYLIGRRQLCLLLSLNILISFLMFGYVLFCYYAM